jgi:glutamate---cysteine ligase / carboxylate-amine ligase
VSQPVSSADPFAGHAFGSAFSVGVEEELLLVDPRSRALSHDAERVIAAVEQPARGQVDHEAYAAELELRSPPSSTAGEAAAALAAARDAALAAGATLVGAGLHPDARLGDVQLVRTARYARVEDDMRGLILRTPECALHVHVGMPDADTAIRAFNGLRAWLPVLQGLAANSPWWFGADSGMASARAAAVRAYPGRGVPPPFASADEYAAAVAAAAAGGGPSDYTLLWWDLRPHPRRGTVELREMDAQSRLDDVAAIAALVQALGRAAADGPAAITPSEAIAWSSFRAAQDGLGARVLHDGRVAPLREAAEAALERARPHARELGSLAALEGVERILREGNGADRRRAAHARGGVPAMLDELVRETGRRAAA